MMSTDPDLEDMNRLEGELEALFEATAPEVDGVLISRITAHAAAGKRRNPWTMRLAAMALGCTAVLVGMVVFSGHQPASVPSSGEEAVQAGVAEVEIEAGADTNLEQVRVHHGGETNNRRRLPAELTELGDGVDEHEVSLAMGTYLNMDFESEGFDFDDWDGDSQGLTEEELLQVTQDLLRNGG